MLIKLLDFLNWAFMYYIFGYAITFFVSTLFAVTYLFERKEQERHDNDYYIRNEKNFIPISVLVPAYNEEVTIADCILSLITLDYPEYEVVIIDDGSKDGTVDHLIESFNLEQTARPVRKLLGTKPYHEIYTRNINGVMVTLVKKENGGKADALNMGVNISRYPYVVALDADSMLLKKDSLKKISMPIMEDERTVAVGGNINIANSVVIEDGEVVKTFLPKNFAVLMQMVEYARIFITTRVWFNQFNGNLIISGAFGLFRKDVVVSVGGYKSQSIGEDMLMVVDIHAFFRRNRKEYKISYVPDAICWSQVPEKWKDLATQRKRWHIGLMQSIFQHFYMFLNPTFGWIGMFSFVYYFFYETISCVIELVGLIMIITSFSLGLINVQFFATFLLVYVLFSSVISVSSILLSYYLLEDRYNLKRLLAYILLSLIEAVGYRQFSTIQRLIAMLGYKKYSKSWGRIERKSHLKS
ncbi:MULTISPECIES: glycosyltransferase family 2 protein [unclassified Fusibacter]|uniref:glycosyltransferase family 2 protein n=1 Tax=unclassified Fusibacter TaxID=2624464 RepID=UPI0010112327|nr:MULTISPECIES: glycosyltransferase [unclassified Fusibacter]MCK8059601.1 glycosyltransferase [Fusibacter sp. A2]NPE21402.1 glycosyltransferase family 2 protein [Fusibacter sp. A1]RXV61817.1 glycosyltransferase family 2 protein [Fusibacter sp. A1]